MACSKYEYVKKFQQISTALLETYIVVRVDGRAFTKFCQTHQFQKPNDVRAIKLMNRAAQHVCENFKDIFLAYGQSDEYSFALSKNSTLFSRRTDKILSCIVSAFSSAYVFYWPHYFENTSLKQIPMFDSRVVVYPNQKCLKDYFRWRQVDCHINNLYNTVFWCMMKRGQSNTEVENILKDTNSAQKNEILFTEFGINYNKLDDIYRRGTFLCYRQVEVENSQKDVEQKIQDLKISEDKLVGDQMQKQQEKKQIQKGKLEDKQDNNKEEKKKFSKPKPKKKLVQMHEDCIKEEFWKQIKL